MNLKHQCKVTNSSIVLLTTACLAVATSTAKILCNANDDEFPPDDIMEDDLIETTRPGVPARNTAGQKEVSAIFDL